MNKANAFDWRNFECPVTGKIDLSKQNKEKKSSMHMASHVEKKRVDNPSHGTVFGISGQVVSANPLKMMRRIK